MGEARAGEQSIPRVTGLNGTVLARQVLTSSLAVALPGTLALGAVTLYVLATLGAVDRQLAEITRSLEATRELQLAVGRAESRRAGSVALGGGPGERAEFDQWIGVAETQRACCASAACHGASRAPGEMAALLTPAIERLKRDGRSILESGLWVEAAADDSIEGVHSRIRAIDGELNRMSSGLRRRVDDLGRRAASVSRSASVLTASLTVAITVAAAGGAVALARRIARPVGELLVGTRRIMAGDWRYRVPTGAGGEIAELGSSFNAMMGELCDHRERLEEYNRTLERRVDARSNERRRAERAFEQVERLASLGRLAAGVAHRLNNPLTGIVMTAGLLEEEATPGSPLLADLRTIAAEAHRCSHLIDELRRFASPSALHKAPSSVSAVIERARSSTESELAARGVRVERDIAPDIAEVDWDADQIAQVLVSLFMNAVPAMPDGGALRVDARHASGWLAIEILDTGSWLPPAHRPRIFDPFFTTRPDGTGLGLSISQRIVPDHGGTIEVDSRTLDERGGAGDVATTPRIVLPIAAGADSGGTRVPGRGPAH
jgi:signal transduction histidine kinase